MSTENQPLDNEPQDTQDDFDSAFDEYAGKTKAPDERDEYHRDQEPASAAAWARINDRSTSCSSNYSNASSTPSTPMVVKNPTTSAATKPPKRWVATIGTLLRRTFPTWPAPSKLV